MHGHSLLVLPAVAQQVSAIKQRLSQGIQDDFAAPSCQLLVKCGNTDAAPTRCKAWHIMMHTKQSIMAQRDQAAVPLSAPASNAAGGLGMSLSLVPQNPTAPYFLLIVSGQIVRATGRLTLLACPGSHQSGLLWHQ